MTNSPYKWPTGKYCLSNLMFLLLSVYFSEIQKPCTLSSNRYINTFRSALSACSCWLILTVTCRRRHHNALKHPIFLLLYSGVARAIFNERILVLLSVPRDGAGAVVAFPVVFQQFVKALPESSLSGPGDAWCYCWGRWREHPSLTQGTKSSRKNWTVAHRRMNSVVFLLYFEFETKCDHTKEHCF